MSLPSSGPISMGQISGELGYGTSDNTDLQALHALVAELRAEINALKGTV